RARPVERGRAGVRGHQGAEQGGDLGRSALAPLERDQGRDRSRRRDGRGRPRLGGRRRGRRPGSVHPLGRMSQGLDRRELFVPLGIGLGTDVDPKLLPVGKVTQMENLLWTPQAGDQAGTKRPGYAAMPNNYVTSGSPAALPVPWQFAQHKGTTLALGVAGPRPIAAYAPSLSKWMVPPVAVADGANGIACKLRGQVIATRQTVDRSDTTTGFVATNQQVDVATDGTLALVAWTHVVATGTQILAKFVELATGRVLFSYNLAAGAGGIAVPQAIFTNGIFTLLWIDLGAGHVNEVHWSAGAVESGTAAPSAVVAVLTGFVSCGIGISAAALLYSATGHVTMSVYAAGVPGAVTTTTIKDSASTPIPLGSGLGERSR